ncbi:MAG: T9SS type A sorting domain-containing protein [Candidatus Marinimicrobia bacterium]|nr:T9SS type A sorting domain-containing protein [Candidatus Neomarinimicrobiota bacterium]
MKKSYLPLLFTLFCWLINGYGQNFEHGFSFYLPADDTTTQKFLPQFTVNPIKADEFVTITGDGHFGIKGRRVRFWGVNLAADGAFPVKSKAGFIAGRMRKMGINLVRFHHMDNPWSNQSLFEWGQDTRHLNPLTLDRFEYLIQALKSNGIYANINLHCSRTVTVSDGIVDADSLLDFGKGVNLFDPDLITLQKEYARQLLTHVNPYTGLALVHDPVMAMVEIVNENSLYRMWREDVLKSFDDGGKLTLRHLKMLDTLWSEFLLNIYGNTATLRSVWNAQVDTSQFINQIADSGFETLPLEGHWELEMHNSANALMTLVGDAWEGGRCARVTVLQPSDESWHLQWKQPDLTISMDSIYIITFVARADDNREIELAVQKNSSPWTYYAGMNFILSTEWQEYQFVFQASGTCAGDTRLSFNLGGFAGSYWFDNVSFGNNIIKGILDSESLEDQSVRRIGYNECLQFSNQRVRDISQFYIELQNRFFDEMGTFLKDELGVRVPITGTNWNVGVGDLVTQSRLDYLDNHAYWDHPQFPNTPWSSTDWKINNTSMLTSKSGGTISSLFGGIPVLGKPFTVSEYNHPFPNRFQSEGVLMAAAYAGFHDIDALLLFDYNGSSSDDWETDFISSYFSIHRNTVMMALLPACARAFREGYIRPADEMLTITYNPDDILLAPKNDGGSWAGYFPVSQKLALQHALRIDNFNAVQRVHPIEFNPAFPLSTDTDELTWNYDLFTVNTPKFIGLTGWLHDYTNYPVGDLELLGAGNVATLTWISLENCPLNISRKSMITVSTRIQNLNMIWDDIYTFHNNWGHAPTEIAPVIVYLELNINADSLYVFPLDSIGAEKGLPQLVFPEENGRFRILLDQTRTPTVWFGIEAYGDLIQENRVKSNPGPQTFGLHRIYPNPFNSQTAIEFLLPSEKQVTLSIYDLKGRQVYSVQKRLNSGSHRLIWEGRDESKKMVASGVYFIRLTWDNQEFTKKCLFLR